MRLPQWLMPRNTPNTPFVPNAPGVQGNPPGINGQTNTPTPAAPVKTLTIRKPDLPKKAKSSHFQQRGGGVASTSVTKFVIDQKTRTAKPDFVAIPPYDASRPSTLKNVAPLPTEADYRENAVMSLPTDGNLSHLQNVKRYYHLVDQAAYFDQNKNSASCRRTLHRALGAVQTRLEAIDRREQIGILADNKKVPTNELPGAEMVVITGAVARACQKHGAQMADAARGLAYLCNIDLLESIRNPSNRLIQEPISCPSMVGQGNRETGIEYDHNDQALAWTIAHELATSSLGFEALKRISHHVPRDHPADALLNDPFLDAAGKKQIMSIKEKYDAVTKSLDSHDDIMLQLYFKAAREQAEAVSHGKYSNQFPRSTPTNIRLRREEQDTNEWTLLDKGLSAIEHHINESGRYGAQLRASVFARPGLGTMPARHDVPHEYGDGPVRKKWPYKDDHEWAAAAIRNGIYTDAEKDANGKPTLFHKLQQRLDKNEKWVERAIKKPPARNVREKLTRAAHKLEVIFMPSHRKSPYEAIKLADEIPIEAANGEPLTIIRDAFGNATQGVLRDARHMKGMLSILANALREAEPNRNAPAIVKDAPMQASELPTNPVRRATLLRKMARIAMLEYTDTKKTYVWRITHADSIATITDKDLVKATLKDFVAGEMDEADIDVFNSYIDTTDGIPLEKLERWGQRAGAPQPDEVVEATINDEKNPWYAWGEGINRLYGNKPYVDATNALDSKEKLAELFAGGIVEGELGSRSTMTNNAKHGGGTKGASGNISRIFLGFFAGVRADIRAEKTPQAVVEFGTGAQGNELFFGTQNGWRKQFGGGGQAGIPLGSSPVSLSASGDGYLAHDSNHHKGAIIRFPRTETGLTGDAVNNAKLAKVMTKLIDRPAIDAADPDGTNRERFAPGRDGESSLKNLLQEWPELSASWADVDEVTLSGGIGSKIVAAVGVGAARFGLAGAGVGYDRKKSTMKHVESPGAALGVIKRSEGTGAVASVSGGIGAVSAVFKLEGASGAAIELLGKPLSVGMPSLDIATVQANLFRTGTSKKDTMIIRDGVLHSTSYRLVTHQSAKAFIDAVSPTLHRYAHVKLRKHGGVVGEPGQEASQAALEAHFQQAKQFLEKVKLSADPSQVFQEYLELKPAAVKRANAISAVRDAAVKLGDHAAVKECDDHLYALHHDDDSWEETFLIQVEHQMKNDLLQINAGVRHARGFTMTTTNIKDGF